jgi:hypothetical protein
MQPDALPADEGGHGRLRTKLANLELPPQAGRPTSPVAADISGHLYVLPENDGPIEAAGLEVGDETTLVLRIDGQERRLPCGSGEWRGGSRLPFGGRAMSRAEQAVAASGAWTDDHTYTVKACLHETPFCVTLRLEFEGDILLFDQEMNVAFGPTKQPQLVGRLGP